MAILRHEQQLGTNVSLLLTHHKEIGHKVTWYMERWEET